MKKVLSFVLVLTLVLGSFSMVFAAPAHTSLSDVAGDANEQAITVVNDLGIVEGYTDGTFKSANNVTRAEFAAMITRALAIPESALAGYTSTNFKDASGYGWAVKYLGFCESRGIMVGDGNGNAMPGRTVTVNEAITMVLRAVGLTNNSAFLVGSWPANYVTVAQNEGLYDDVAATATVNRGNAAQIIYNALTIAGFAVNADGQTSRTTASLLNALDCTNDEELVNYNDDTLIALTDYVGAWADVYRNKDGEIVAVDPISTFLTGDFNDDGTEFEADDTTYNVSSFTSAAAINNAATTYEAYANRAAVADKTDVTIAADVTGKTITKVYSVAEWTITVNDQADSDVQDEIADDQKLLGVEFELDKSKEIDNTKYTLAGVSKLSDIAEDDVVYVYAYDNSASNEIVKIEVGTDTVEGKVTRVAKDSDGDTTYTIDGKKYYIAEHAAVTSFKVGDEGTFTLDYAGDIYAWDETNTKADNYAVVTYEKYTSGKDLMISLLDKEGNEKDYVVKDKDDVKASASALNKGDVVTFSLNKDGKIDDIEAADTDSVTGKVAKSGKLIGTTPIKSSAVVFVEDDGDYSVDKVSSITTDDEITVDVVTDDGEIVVICVTDAELGNSDDSYGIVIKIDGKGENADGDTVQLLDVIIDGKTIEDAITDDLSVAATASETPDKAALVKIAVDADGVITKVEANGLDAADVIDETATTVSSISNGTVKVANDARAYELSDSVAIYVWDADDEEWQVKRANQLKGTHAVFYETDDDKDGIDIVLAWE